MVTTASEPGPLTAPRERVSSRRAPPRLSGGLPLVGHTVDFVRDTVGLLHRAYRECGEVAEFWLLNRRMVLMTGPEASEAFFMAPDELLSQREVYALMAPIFGKNIIFDAPPERMAEQKGMLMPALRHGRMGGYCEIIAHEVRRATASWGAEGELELLPFTKVLTNFTSSACLLGREFREEMTEEFASLYHDLEQGATPIAYLSPNLPIPAFRKRDRARARLVELISSIIEKRQRAGITGEDFLQTLMEARYKDGSAPSGDEITGLLLAAMFAGHHTSSVSTAWTLLELLRHPEYLQRVTAQLGEVYASVGPTEVGLESLREVVLLEYGIKEAIRLHPPLFMLLRYAKQDFHYDGYVIPQGTWVIASPQVSHSLHSVFRAPSRFDPDRFGPPRQEDQLPFAYLTFGGGRHRCMGNAFALMQIKVILGLLLRNFEFTLTDDPIVPDFNGLVVGPKQPCRVRYRRIARGRDGG